MKLEKRTQERPYKYFLLSLGDCLTADSSFDWFWGPDGKLKVIEAIEEESEEYAEEEDSNPVFDWSWGPDGRLKVQDVVCCTVHGSKDNFVLDFINQKAPELKDKLVFTYLIAI